MRSTGVEVAQLPVRVNCVDACENFLYVFKVEYSHIKQLVL